VQHPAVEAGGDDPGAKVIEQPGLQPGRLLREPAHRDVVALHDEVGARRHDVA
jgi:hypothetical protein